MTTPVSTKICVDCEREWPLDRYRADNAWPDSCFKCRASGISLTLQGGKEYWNADTEKRRSERAVSEARAAGMEPVPATTGKAYGGIGKNTLAKIGEISKKNGAFGKKAVSTSNSSANGAS